METLILANVGPEHAWLIIAIIAAWMVLMCLKTLGHGYYTAVCWHNLKVQAHNLRIRHENEIKDMKRSTILKEAKKRNIDVDGLMENAGIQETPSMKTEAGEVAEMPAQAA